MAGVEKRSPTHFDAMPDRDPTPDKMLLGAPEGGGGSEARAGGGCRAHEGMRARRESYRSTRSARRCRPKRSHALMGVAQRLTKQHFFARYI